MPITHAHDKATADPLTPDVSSRAQVHSLWDDLADFDAARVDQAADFLMRALCDLIGADNAMWLGLVRFADDRSGDPAYGWRPLSMRLLHPNDRLVAAIREQAQALGKEVLNPAVAGVLGAAGSFHAFRLTDIAPAVWFESEVYRSYYRDCGRDDAIYVAFPINSDTESCFCMFRNGRPRSFTAAERDLAAYVLRGIKWFHRQLLLSHGLLVARTPLTPVERRVLQGLLAGQAEKAIAAELGKSQHTIHDNITAIYRKFGVGNRPALLALWLGQSA